MDAPTYYLAFPPKKLHEKERIVTEETSLPPVDLPLLSRVFRKHTKRVLEIFHNELLMNSLNLMTKDYSQKDSIQGSFHLKTLCIIAFVEFTEFTEFTSIASQSEKNRTCPFTQCTVQTTLLAII